MATIPQNLTIDQMLRDATATGRADVGLMLSRFNESQLLNGRSFRTLPNRAGDEWEVATDLPATERRSLNEDFTATGGRTEPGYAAMKIYGLKLQQDKAARRMGLADPVKQTNMAARSMRLTIEADAITGDPTSNPEAMPGLQFHAENSGDTPRTSISAGTTSGGAALSKYLLDNAIDECFNPVEIILPMKLRNRMTNASRDNVVAGDIRYEEGSFGQRLAFYGPLRLTTVERSVANVRLLDFTEAASAGASTAASMYIVGEGYEWFQNGPPTLDPLAVTGSQEPREMMWILSNRAERYSVIRIKHIGDLAMVA